VDGFPNVGLDRLYWYALAIKGISLFLLRTMRVLTEILKLYGTAEVAGPKSNLELLKILRKHQPTTTDDGLLAWCGVMMAEAFERAGFKVMIPKGYMGARSWMNLPDPVTLEQAQLGDIVIFWRGTPDGWQGHVGIYISHNSDNIFVLGGNQGDRVSIAPYAKTRLLGIRKQPK
jgi:uncharacterized protein (TIGR02594 family)